MRLQHSFGFVVGYAKVLLDDTPVKKFMTVAVQTRNLNIYEVGRQGFVRRQMTRYVDTEGRLMIYVICSKLIVERGTHRRRCLVSQYIIFVNT